MTDNWVFSTFASYLSDDSNKKKLDTDQLLIFLHLLGVDTAGHAYTPNSEEYRSTLANIDNKLPTLISTLENHYNNDEQTAYIITSDHGMGSRGSHGDGDPDNTRVPILTWGLGINNPIKLSNDDQFISGLTINANNLEEERKLMKRWKLNELKRIDINQADTATLMVLP